MFHGDLLTCCSRLPSVLASMHPGACLFAEDPGRQRTRRPSAERKPVYAQSKKAAASSPRTAAAAALAA
eukprot:scaffold120968_cov18-Phaeocystis_antarctica.AAC.1